MGWYAKERARDRIAELSTHGLDLVSFWSEARDVISPAVQHYMAPCWFTLDPASLLVTSHYDHDEIPELPRGWLAHEYYEDDVHTMAHVAQSERGVSTIHEATGGDPSRSSDGSSTSSRTARSRSCSSRCGRARERRGGCSASIASRGSRCSTPTSSSS